MPPTKYNARKASLLRLPIVQLFHAINCMMIRDQAYGVKATKQEIVAIDSVRQWLSGLFDAFLYTCDLRAKAGRERRATMMTPTFDDVRSAMVQSDHVALIPPDQIWTKRISKPINFGRDSKNSLSLSFHRGEIIVR